MITATLTFPTPYPVSAVVTSLVRIDTGSTVSGSVSGAGATWVLSITEPAPAIIYSYVLTFTFPGGSTAQAAGNVNGTPLANPTGYYTSYSLMVTKYGEKNIARWSNLNNDDTLPNFANIALGISTFESQINTFYANGPYNVPLTPISPMIQDWATTGSAYWVYTVRGIWESDPEGMKLKQQYNQVINMMAVYKGITSTLSLGCQRRWPSPTAAVPARGFR